MRFLLAALLASSLLAGCGNTCDDLIDACDLCTADEGGPKDTMRESETCTTVIEADDAAACEAAIPAVEAACPAS